MRSWVLMLVAVCAWFGCSTAMAQPIEGKSNCTASGADYGAGLRLVQSCVSVAQQQELDAYYQIRIDVKPGDGFSNLTELTEENENFLHNFLRSLIGTKKVQSAVFGFEIKQNDYEYPFIPVMQFQRVDGNDWQSFVPVNWRSAFHRLSPTGDFEITGYFRFSNERNVDFGPTSSLIQELGIGLASPVTSEFFSLAEDFANSVLKQNGVDARSGTSFAMNVGGADNFLYDFAISDPTGEAQFATVRIRLVGTTSLLRNPAELDNLQSTRITSQVSNEELKLLTSQLTTAALNKWSIDSVALNSASIENLQISEPYDESSLETLCKTLSSMVTSSFGVTEDDSLLLRGSIYDRATSQFDGRLRRLEACFGTEERQRLSVLLGLRETAVVDPVVIPDSRPIDDFEALTKLGCWLAGRAGQSCGSSQALDDYVEELLADTIVIGALEGLGTEGIASKLPASTYEVDRETFMTALRASFVRYGDINRPTGRVGVWTSELRAACDGNIIFAFPLIDQDDRITGISFRRATSDQRPSCEPQAAQTSPS